MKRTLLKTLLVATGLAAGANAWGAETTTTFDFEDGNAVFTGDSRVTVGIESDATLGSNVVSFTCASNAQNGYSFAHYDFTELAQKAQKVAVSFDYWNTNGGRGIVSLGDASVRGTTGGSSKVTYNGEGALFRIGSDKSNFYINTTTYKLADYCGQWLNVSVVVDVVNKTVDYTVKNASGEVLKSETGIAYYNSVSSCTQIDVFGYINSNKMVMIDNLSITVTTDESAVYTSYKVSYVDESGAEVKEARIATDVLANSEILLLDDDIEDFKTEDGLTKYIYVSDDASGQTVNADGSSVVKVTFRKASTYSYSVSTNLGETLGSGSNFEKETISVPYQRYYNVGGTLYEKAATNQVFKHSFVLTMDNQAETVEYSAKEITNVVYYSEGENIEGATKVASGNIEARASNAAAGYAAETDLTLTTLPAGKYVMSARINNPSGATTFTFNAGDQTVLSVVGDGKSNMIDGTSAEFSLTEETSITLGAGGSSTAAVDYVYIQKTGEALTVTDAGFATFAPSSNVVIPEGIEAYTITLSGSTISATSIATGAVIKAGEGILVKAAAGTYTFNVSAQDGVVLTNNNLKGATDAVAADGSQYILAQVDGQVGFAKATTGTIAAGKAYLEVTSTGSNEFYPLTFGEATVIDAAKSASVEGEETIVNLLGSEVSESAKGILIKGGKKFMNK